VRIENRIAFVGNPIFSLYCYMNCHTIFKWVLISAFMFCTSVKAQNNTYILLRHAEKDTLLPGSTAMNANPPLSKKGHKRAKKLVRILKDYSIDSIFSTDFLRTTATVAPLSKKLHVSVIKYSHKTLPLFANQLLHTQNKTMVIVGHSNSTPALVNLLIKQEKYQALDESIFSKIFIVRIVDGNSTVEVIDY
jgi:2,3-bisphosphoglycerate-dependent phosphoglycerate mutase